MSTPDPLQAPDLDPDTGLPPKPEQPDCCFSGCAQCVLDTYTEEMREWQRRCDEIRAARNAR